MDEENCNDMDFFDQKIFCNSTILNHPDEKIEEKFVDDYASNFNEAMGKSNKCFNLLLTYGKFNKTLGASNMGGCKLPKLHYLHF